MVRGGIVALVEGFLGSVIVVLWLLRGLFGGGFFTGRGRFRLELHKVVRGWRAGNVAERGLELALVLIVNQGGGGFLQKVETGLVLGWGRGWNTVGLLAVVAGGACGCTGGGVRMPRRLLLVVVRRRRFVRGCSVR